MKYYLKKLNKNELGIKGDGSIARGRFFYISKACENFFPHLSKSVNNDNVLLPIVPPFANTKIYSAYVYHNDKYNVGGTRDEFRLYLNRNLDPERNYFHIDDIVVFERIETNTPIPIYLIYKYSYGETYYNELDALLTTFTIGGAHALVENKIHFLPDRQFNIEEAKVVVPQEIINEIVIQQEEVLLNEALGVEEARGASLFGPDSFRDFVLLAYGYKCAITGKVINYKNLSNLEAAHIQPKAQAGTFLPCNGIALSRDMHWAFDKGLISISDDFIVIVHDEMKNSILMEYAGRPISIPVDPYFQPEKKFLKHHRERIFGLFLYSGSIRSNQ